VTDTEHSVGGVLTAEPSSVADERPDERATDQPVTTGGNRGRVLLLAAAGYLFCSVVLWWNVWSSHPTSTTTCGCGDTSLFTWFLEWPAYAISHDLNPLYSTAMFHPSGVNLLSNTAELGLGVVLAPVTWIFGPIATLNVSLTLSPLLSSLAMFVLVRRWVRWQPAAFVAGLLYGFSPFILIGLTDAHLMLSMVPIPPLVVLCLDELLLRQHRPPARTGVVLGLLVTAQFFIGSEVLVLTIIAAAIGIAFVALYGLWHIEELMRRVRHALVALGTAVVTAGVLLAYPVWFALAGPAHLSGPVWGPDSPISYGGTNGKDYLLPAVPSATTTALGHRLGGYQAPTLSGQYLGIGLLAVLAIGCVLWRRDRRLWLFGAVGAVSVPLSFGLHLRSWTVWRLFVRFPLMDNVIPSRFLLITYLCAAVMLGVIVDHTYRAVARWNAAPPDERRPRMPGVALRGAGAIAALAVAVIALLPIAGYYSSGVPLAARPVILPAWFRAEAPRLHGHQVILVFPVPFSLTQSAMTWQAVDGMSYSMVGGGGPNALITRAGPEAPGQAYLANLSIAGGPQAVVPEEVSAVRKALDGWGATMVVIPDPTNLPIYERLHLVRTTAVLITAATGRQPVRQHGAWVWTRLDHAGPAVAASSDRLALCGAGPAGGSVVSIQRSTACVVATPATDR